MNSPGFFFPSVQEFVTFSGGDHAIQKILIANNGIGATKAIRSIRRWSFETFGNDRMIQFVVMATPEDMRANAEYIRMADEVVDVPGGSNNNNYANINLICEIAIRHKVDAVMPMWGHASENPNLPTSLLKLPHKVSFIGPPAEPMQALGDKIGSTIIAQSAGVPTIGWNGDHLKVDYKATGIPQEVYDQANVITAEDALACAQRIGFPVMIKASEGGGGKGIRKVLRAEDVMTLYRQVQNEIPGSPIFVMKMASKARHLEVQLLADKYGDAIALSGRDCSVQRRHQKIIEEGPPTACSEETFRLMEKAAVSLAKTVGYCNAGTVEYLYLEENNTFAFLELNPRLQVEHPVTENILGLNLPCCQLQVAMGLPLHRISDVRKMYGRNPIGRDTIDFDFSERLPLKRHCIAVRVTAENPDASFQPSSGNIKELQFFSSIDVWGYFSVNNSGLIHEFADSQFGHIFASGPTREGARKAMIVALKELQIRGDIRTTIEYIVKMLQSKDFVENRIDTDWLDGRLARHTELCAIENAKYCPPPTLIALCGAALQGFQHFEQRGKEFEDMLKVGQVPGKDTLSPSVKIDLIFANVKYRTICLQSGAMSVIVECNGGRQNINIRPLADGGYLMTVSGKSHTAYAKHESGGSLRMILDGHTCIFTPEYDPTRLTSSVAGKLARLLVPDGAHLDKGDPYVEIEVMKMYMSLKAAEAGTVHFQMSEGATLTPGDVVAMVKLDDPDKVVKSETFMGKLQQSDQTADETAADASSFALPHVVMREAHRKICQVMEGYPVPEAEADIALESYLQSYSEKLLPVYEVEEAMSVLRGRIDADLFEKIIRINTDYKAYVTSNRTPLGSTIGLRGGSTFADSTYPSATILSELHANAQALPFDKRTVFSNQTAAVWAAAERYLYTPEIRTLAGLLRIVEDYLEVEKLFDNMSFTDVVTQLRKDYGSDFNKVLGLCRSHINVEAKNIMIVKIMGEVAQLPIPTVQQRPSLPMGVPLKNEINTRNLKLRLTALARLRQPVYSHVSFVANMVLMKQYTLKPEQRRQRMHETIMAALTTGEPVGHGDRALHIKKFVDGNIVVRDLLIDALRNDRDYQIAAMELYLLKNYHTTHTMEKNMTSGSSLSDDGSTGDMNPWIRFTFKTKQVQGIADIPGRDMNALKKHRMGAADPLQKSVHDPNAWMTRIGIMVAVDSLGDLPFLFPLIMGKFPIKGPSQSSVNVVHVIVMRNTSAEVDDDGTSAVISAYLKPLADTLDARGIRRVSFFVPRPMMQRSNSFGSSMNQRSNHDNTHEHSTDLASIFTYRSKFGFGEDLLSRHIEAPHAFHLDLARLENFSVTLDAAQTSSGNVFLYKAVPRDIKGAPRRFFARLLSFTTDVHNSEAESLFVEALDHLGLVIAKEEAAGNKGGSATRASSTSAANHVFLNIVSPETVVDPDFFDADLKRICTKYWYKMVRLAVTTVELKISCRLSRDSEPIALRFVASNPTGFVLNVVQYYEAVSMIDGNTVFRSISNGAPPGPLNGEQITKPYETSQKFERQRAEAMAASDTLYVYDWPMLFENAGQKEWEVFANERPSIKVIVPEQPFFCQELVLHDQVTHQPLVKGWTAKDAESALLLPITREPGLNDVGMVAWLASIKTPEYPGGRQVVFICNDITHQAGSFGTKEDAVFFKASEYARKHGLPRLYLAANSGARIGMAQSLKDKFQVCWADVADPSKGFKYIYFTKEDYQALMLKYKNDVEAMPLICSRIDGPNGEDRYLITDIIGEEPDLGVENLMGSGLIAGETSRAYNDIFTLTLVVGRTVGIGAYLVRLGQRTIQKTRSSPIILTGYQALNKLMGREIYTTNDQLGGPMIMFPNGVSHLLADTHFEMVEKALQWLSFIPMCKGSALPLRDITGIDTFDRKVEFAPLKGLTYDPRLLFCGVTSGDTWQSGFFDRGSFVETLSGWAKTVVVGRGRLGGIPMGVIVTENRTAEALKPADPADMTSREKMVQQAGGVWFPDSAYKTAQALKDFNREGLPCIVFANWRGFSGGQRDMFDEVLKFGSMIVDALVAYQQPLFVYIPPFAELRGGAWVVVDSTINADAMEFYAAEDARGGVLEAAGAASIKFRDRDIVATAHRLDHVLAQLDQDVKAGKASSPPLDTSALEKQIKQREKLLFGVYQQVAVHFADLHDTPGRMRSKGVIRKQVQWAESRIFFYWRLRRRMQEFHIADTIMKGSQKSGTRKELIADFGEWFSTLTGRPDLWDDDRMVVSVLESADNIALVNSYVAEKRAAVLSSQLAERLSEVVAISDTDDATSTAILSQAFSQMSAQDRAVLLKALTSNEATKL